MDIDNGATIEWKYNSNNYGRTDAPHAEIAATF